MSAGDRTILGAIVLVSMIVMLPACDRKHVLDDAEILEISPPSARVAPGRTQQFTVKVWGREDVAAIWSVRGVGYITGDGLYIAPYIVGAGGTDVVEATVPSKHGSTILTAAVILGAGAFPGADSCRGPDQASLPNPGEYVAVDSLPEALIKVSPVYPDSAREHGIEGLVIVRALVCTTGRVLDVAIVTSVPGLDVASMDAVRQWVFRPAAKNGKPVAVWVHIPVRYALRGSTVEAAKVRSAS